MCMALNYDEIEKALAEMQPRHRLYALVKKEMVKRGHWKYLGRGKPVTANLKKSGIKQVEIVRNDQGQPIILTGLLPNGTYGIAADQARPFTEEELNDAELFNKHLEDLNKRVDSQK